MKGQFYFHMNNYIKDMLKLHSFSKALLIKHLCSGFVDQQLDPIRIFKTVNSVFIVIHFHGDMIHSFPVFLHRYGELTWPALDLKGGVWSLPKPLSISNTIQILWVWWIIRCECQEVKTKPIIRNILNRKMLWLQTCIESCFIPNLSLYTFKLAFTINLNDIF